MNHRERIMAAFNGQPVDRVPFSFWFHFVKNEDKVDAMEDPGILGCSDIQVTGWSTLSPWRILRGLRPWTGNIPGSRHM